MAKVCEVCNEEYEAKRADSITCSDTCKKKRQRLKGTSGDNIKGDIAKGDIGCNSVIGDKFCSCGQRIHAVSHPIGSHEVQPTKSTRHLHSYFDGYRAINQPDMSVVQ